MCFFRRLWNAVRRNRIDADLQHELDTHLSLIEEEELGRGSTAAHARERARSRFGSPIAYREQAHDVLIASWIEETSKDVVFAARRLVRSPAFSLASVLTLALAIGANASIFAIVERVVLNPLPYRDSNRLIELDHAMQRLNVPSGMGMTLGLHYHYLDRSRTLEGLALYRTDQLTLRTTNGEPERIRIVRATATLASVLGVSPALGRWFTVEEGRPGSPSVAVLSYGLWSRRFASDPHILGRSVVLEGVATEVIGVMPRSYAFPDPQVEMWIPDRIARGMGFGTWTYESVARMRDGFTVADVAAELRGLIADLPQAYPNDPLALANGPAVGLTSAPRTLKEATVGNVARPLFILLASMGLVLLVACANIANLFLVRSDARRREVAIRRALGAGKAGIVRYFLAESALLAAAGGTVGLALAWAAVRLLVGFGPTNLPRLEEVRIDEVAVAFTVVLSAVAALIFGAIPLWRPFQLVAPLHEHGRGNTASKGRHRTRHLLMGMQIAFAVVLLIVAGLMLRSFQKLRAFDPGFDPSAALTFSIGLVGADYPTRDAAVRAHHAALDRLSALPGATAVSASTCLPLAGSCWGSTVRVEGRTYSPRTVPPVALFRAVAGGYFETMGMRLLHGRSITRSDIERDEPIVVVDETLANQFFPNQDPVGQRLASNRPPARIGLPPSLTWMTVVGVVAKTPRATLGEANPVPQLYIPMSISGGPDIPKDLMAGPDVSAMNYVIRSLTPPRDLLPAVRHALDTVDKNLAIAQASTLQEALDRAAAHMAYTMVLLAVAAGMAIVLGAIGIYGVMSYIVQQRTAEIGVRLALGASPRGIVGMIVRQGGSVTLAGVAVGLAAALVGGRPIQSLLYEVSPRDPVVFAAAAVALFGVGLLACWLSARRAAGVSLLEALRAD